VRERWPVDEPIAVSVTVPAWLPFTEIRLCSEDGTQPVASAAGQGLIGCGNCARSARTRWSYQELQRLELGPQSVVLDVVVERLPEPRSRRGQRGNPPAAAPPGILWNGTLEFHVQVVPSIEDVLPGVHGDELEASVLKALDPRLFYYEGRKLAVHASTDDVPELASTALALQFEVFEGNEVRMTGSLVTLGQQDLEYYYTDDPPCWDLPEEFAPARWTIRVRGRAKGALRVWNATRRWDGELVIPLSEVEHY
jgi:hypothetical protein